MIHNISKFIVIFSLCIGFNTCMAQVGSEIGVFLGGSYYNGDINPQHLFSEIKPAYGGFYKYNLDRRLAAKIGVNYANLSSHEENYFDDPNRDAEFKTNVFEVTLIGEFNFFQFYSGSRKNRYTPYLFGGVGFSSFSGDYAYNQNPSTLSSPLYTKGSYSGNSINIPFGIGFKFSISDALTLSTEWGYRKVFSDKLDGLGEMYSNNAQNPYYNVQLSNSKTNDWHSIVGVALSFDLTIFKNKECDN